MTVRLLPLIGKAPGIAKAREELTEAIGAPVQDAAILDPESAAQREREGQAMRERAKLELADAAAAIKRMEQGK